MALTGDQRKLVKKALKTASKYGASGKVKKALIEAGLVESNLRPLDYGDRDSQGYLQQRPSQGWGSPAQVRNVGYATKQFVTRANRIAGKYGSAGQLAQAVQRSANPGAYDKRSRDAESILKGRGGSSSGGGSGGGGRSSVTRSGTVKGTDNSPTRKALISQYLQTQPRPSKNDPYGTRQQSALIGLQAGLKANPDGPDRKVSVTVKVPGSKTAGGGSSTDTGAKGTARFEGKTVAAWIKPELEYARKHGWKGTVNSGFRSRAEQTRIYNSGVRPAAKPGTSNHEGTEFPRGAVDVSDAATLSRILKAKGSKLKWAGSKDPVHFSVLQTWNTVLNVLAVVVPLIIVVVGVRLLPKYMQARDAQAQLEEKDRAIETHQQTIDALTGRVNTLENDVRECRRLATDTQREARCGAAGMRSRRSSRRSRRCWRFGMRSRRCMLGWRRRWMLRGT
jgi:hypothetical protein